MEQRRGHLKKDAPFIFEFPKPIKHACPNQHYSVILGKMEKLSPQLLQTKQHFDVLDGLRGIAALAIVVFHFMEWIYTDPTQNFIGHGFLAVDFFFCLSGFVIAYAYDQRIKKMGSMEFFKSRLIRLHPLVILGAVLGLIAFLMDPFENTVATYSTGKIFLLFLYSILLIPFPAMEDRAFNLFGLNAPSWSLFWEYIANIAYAFILCKLNRRYLLLLTCLAAILLGWISYRTGNLLGGWNDDTFWHGGARLAYSFSAGLLIYRSNWIIKNRLGFVGLSLLLILAFIMPHFTWNWMAEALVVLFYFPLLVALGAGTSLSSTWKNICVYAGKISYPLYMTHYAVIWIFGHYLTHRKPDTTTLVYIVIIGTLLLVGMAHLVMKLYDIPIRKYLTERRQKKLE